LIQELILNVYCIIVRVEILVILKLMDVASRICINLRGNLSGC